MKEKNIEMTHKEHRNLKKELFGVKKFEVNGKKICPYEFECTTKFKSVNYCRTLKYRKCIQYQVYVIKGINERIRSENQGHVDNETVSMKPQLNGLKGKSEKQDDDINLNINSKEISSINRNTLLSDKEDARDNL